MLYHIFQSTWKVILKRFWFFCKDEWDPCNSRLKKLTEIQTTNPAWLDPRKHLILGTEYLPCLCNKKPRRLWIQKTSLPNNKSLSYSSVSHQRVKGSGRLWEDVIALVQLPGIMAVLK
jgi:hypothetical protein